MFSLTETTETSSICFPLKVARVTVMDDVLTIKLLEIINELKIERI